MNSQYETTYNTYFVHIFNKVYAYVYPYFVWIYVDINRSKKLECLLKNVSPNKKFKKISNKMGVKSNFLQQMKFFHKLWHIISQCTLHRIRLWMSSLQLLSASCITRNRINFFSFISFKCWKLCLWDSSKPDIKERLDLQALTLGNIVF